MPVSERCLSLRCLSVLESWPSQRNVCIREVSITEMFVCVGEVSITEKSLSVLNQCSHREVL